MVANLKPSIALAAVRARALMLIPAATVALGMAAEPAAGAVVKCHGQRANVVGTSARDALRPNDLDSGDVVATRGGNDDVEIDHVKNVIICGGPGYDGFEIASGSKTKGIVIFGGDRRDSIVVSDDTVHALVIHGDDGPDLIDGGAGSDKIDGGAGRDYIAANGGNDHVEARGGDDWVQGGRGFDSMFGGGGDDSLFGLEFSVPPRKDKADKGDGGKGRDYCQTTERRSCERKQRTDLPL